MENLFDLGKAQEEAKIGAMRINPDSLDWVRGGGGEGGRGWVAKLFPFAGSSRVMGWSKCNLFYSLICIYPRELITSANRVCIGTSNSTYIDILLIIQDLEGWFQSRTRLVETMVSPWHCFHFVCFLLFVGLTESFSRCLVHTLTNRPLWSNAWRC